jgi:hypothetical protein
MGQLGIEGLKKYQFTIAWKKRCDIHSRLIQQGGREMEDSGHVRAIVKGTNGELAEDIRESAQPTKDARSEHDVDDEVVHLEPVEEIPGRAHPSDPVPGTVPRNVGR